MRCGVPAVPRIWLNMDDLLLHTLALQQWLAAENDREAKKRLQLAAAVLIIGSNEDHAWVVESRCARRQYLGRNALLPNPRLRTPWTRLYSNHNDRAFITTMGVINALGWTREESRTGGVRAATTTST